MKRRPIMRRSLSARGRQHRSAVRRLHHLGRPGPPSLVRRSLLVGVGMLVGNLGIFGAVFVVAGAMGVGMGVHRVTVLVLMFVPGVALPR